MLKVKTDFWWNFKQSYKTCFKNVNKEETFYQNEILRRKKLPGLSGKTRRACERRCW